jgi:cytochrome c oxidase subunit II
VQKLFFYVFLLFTLMVPSQLLADYTLNMHPGVTPISKEIYHLHMLIFWVCVAIGLAVFSVMFYAIIFHRKSRGAVAAQFHDNTWLEVIWSVIPLIILIAISIPATRVLIKIDDHSDSDMTIKITGFMWRWQYDYLDEKIQLMSSLKPSAMLQKYNRDVKSEHYLLDVDYPLVVPIHKKIRFLTTANDVIHSWWVPKLGIKKDAIPGFINETWARIEEPGTYRGQCAELCGVNHGFMPIVVVAKTQEDFDIWLKQQKSSQPKGSHT